MAPFPVSLSFILVVVLVPLAAIEVGWLGVRVGKLIQTKAISERMCAALLRLNNAIVAAVKEFMQPVAVDADRFWGIALACQKERGPAPSTGQRPSGCG